MIDRWVEEFSDKYAQTLGVRVQDLFTLSGEQMIGARVDTHLNVLQQFVSTCCCKQVTKQIAAAKEPTQCFATDAR